MKSALIGHTGFVGGVLRSQTGFDDFYNSANIEDLPGNRYELLVCSGAPAEKWKANQNPKADRDNLERLTHALAGVAAHEVILISTVDVFGRPLEVDESTPIDEAEATPYGRHRRQLERFVEERFQTRVIRLPGLFGSGLRKNAVYDLLHDNMVDRITPESEFQFYDLSNLWNDIQTARTNNLRLLHLATEPVAMSRVAHEVFGVELENHDAPPPVRYDCRSRHAALWGKANGYLYDAAQVLGAMREFVSAERLASESTLGDADVTQG